MTLTPVTPVDTRTFFRPVSRSLVTLLRTLSDDDWGHATVAGSWVVRDIVAHLLDTTLRRLSFHRDGMMPPAPPRPITSERDLLAFINELNRQWVAAAKRLSPKVLTDLYDRASTEQSGWFESLPLDAPPLFPVSWAGDDGSDGWLDIGRDFTELWHHQQQIRLAVAAGPLDARYLAAVIDVAMRGLPHAFRNTPGESGQTVAIDVSGPAGGQWTLVRDTSRWTLFRGDATPATTRIRLDDDSAWRLLFNALPLGEAARAVHVDGRAEFAAPFVRARSVIVRTSRPARSR